MRELRTYGSVGALGGRLPRATRNGYEEINRIANSAWTERESRVGIEDRHTPELRAALTPADYLGFSARSKRGPYASTYVRASSLP